MKTTNLIGITVRDPDGVPHAIVGLTLLLSIALAALLLVGLIGGHPPLTASVALAPIAVVRLARRAGVDRGEQP